jgi:predicted transcriptional regulator
MPVWQCVLVAISLKSMGISDISKKINATYSYISKVVHSLVYLGLIIPDTILPAKHSRPKYICTEPGLLVVQDIKNMRLHLNDAVKYGVR